MCSVRCATDVRCDGERGAGRRSPNIDAPSLRRVGVKFNGGGISVKSCFFVDDRASPTSTAPSILDFVGEAGPKISSSSSELGQLGLSSGQSSSAGLMFMLGLTLTLVFGVRS